MDPDKTLEVARTMVRAWEEATNPDAEHAAARELSSAFAALDDFLSAGGLLPSEWGSQQRAQTLAMVQEFVAACAQALRDEGKPELVEPVTNRLMWGHPDGAAGVQQEAGLERSMTMHPATGRYSLPDDDALTDGSAPKFWHTMTGTPPTPELTGAVFARDFREIDPGQMDDSSHHPLLATCQCGEEISRFSPSEPWKHSDPRV